MHRKGGILETLSQTAPPPQWWRKQARDMSALSAVLLTSIWGPQTHSREPGGLVHPAAFRLPDTWETKWPSSYHKKSAFLNSTFRKTLTVLEVECGAVISVHYWSPCSFPFLRLTFYREPTEGPTCWQAQMTLSYQPVRISLDASNSDQGFQDGVSGA